MRGEAPGDCIGIGRSGVAEHFRQTAEDGGAALSHAAFSDATAP